MKKHLQHAAFAACTIFGSLSLIIIGTPFILTRSQFFVRLLSLVWAKSILFFGKIFCGVNIKIEGEENIPKDKKFILASKHSSTWETLFFYQYFGGAVFVIKKEIFKIPFAAGVAKSLGMIAIDRSKGISAMTSIINAIKNTKTLPLVIFPQGTRVKQQNADYNLDNYPYKKGVVLMSKGSNLPIVLSSHNAFMFWGRSMLSKKTAGTITLKFDSFNKVLQNDADLKAVSQIIESTTSNLITKP